MRRAYAAKTKGLPARTLPVLALAILCFAAGRLTAPTTAALPALPAADEPARFTASPSPWMTPGIIHASACDVSRAAEQGFAVHDPLANPLRFRVRVLRVVDGDTIRVLWHGRDTAVRLLRIDTPEVGQPGYREATDHLRHLIDGDHIDLEFEGPAIECDRYGRLLAYLRKDGHNVNLEMVRSGHAAFYTRYGAGKYHVNFTGD